MTAETILIVDDEEPVRRTFQEWLVGSGLPCEVLVAADAEAALRLANRRPIDLAVLDWNLGAGNDGLRLLEDLSVFQPDIVAILVTGYAHQATPLDAMRMGVRDYLDKNQDLDQSTFLAAVRRQLDRIRPARFRADELSADVVLQFARQPVRDVAGHAFPPTVKPSVGERYFAPSAIRSLIRATADSVGGISGGRTCPDAISPRRSSTHLPGAGFVSTNSRSTSGCRP